MSSLLFTRLSVYTALDLSNAMLLIFYSSKRIGMGLSLGIGYAIVVKAELLCLPAISACCIFTDSGVNERSWLLTSCFYAEK
jgi:hypothetical protein